MKHVSSPTNVSVVCAVYNRADYIKDTIDSVLAQDLNDFEIVVINDGSSDPRVRELLDGYKDPRVRVLHQENAGFTAAIRRAIEMSTGSFIAVQGAGDISLPSRLTKQLEILRSDTTICAVGCRVSAVAVGGDNDGERTLRRMAKQRWKVEDLLQVENVFTHGEVMFRRSIYEKSGGYRLFFKYAQDRDLWLRMGENGDFFVINENLYHRRIFAKDGVAGDLDKSLLQNRLATFAIQCYHERKRYGSDSVDRYDWLAGLFRTRSKTLANKVAYRAIKAVRVKDYDGARELLNVAKSEGTTRLTVLANALYVLTRVPGGESAVRLLLNLIRKVRATSRSSA